GMAERQRPLLLREPALRPDRKRDAGAGVPGARERLERARDRGLLVTEDEQALRLEPREGALEALLGQDLRDGQDPALLGCLDDVGAHALEIHARDLRAPGQHRA